MEDQNKLEHINLPLDDKGKEDSKKRRLSGIDCLLAIVAIGLTFFLSNLLTALFIDDWTSDTAVYFSGFVTQLLFLFFILLIKIVRRWSWRDLGFRPLAMKKVWGTVILFYVISFSFNLIYALYATAHGFNPPENDAYDQLLGQSSWLLVAVNIILTAVLAPVMEETLFRGMICNGLSAHFGQWTAAILSAALFSAVHFQAFGFAPRLVLGLLLARLFQRYNSIYPSIAFHALNNFIAVILGALLI